MKTIVLTGGGTAGHVTPLIALLPQLKKEGYKIQYIGSYNGIEKQLIKDCDVPYYGISSGKLRRYFDFKNFTDPFKVIKGYYQAKSLLKKLKPNIVFSKGGFVSVPVVLAAKSRKIPVIVHESDITPGLANKIAFPSAQIICANFPETMRYLPEGKAHITGTPIRRELFHGDKSKGLSFCGLNNKKPVLLIIGGSTGSKIINDTVKEVLPTLLKDYQIIHLCGKDNLDDSLYHLTGYSQFEYIHSELSDIFAASDLVISRAGANVICELLALRKPNILIPLSQNASRGDQILNAKSFEKQGYSFMIMQEDLNTTSLQQAINTVFSKKKDYINTMTSSKLNNSITSILELIKEIELN
ncbi:MAG TPA: undecaprenyldiphospho-muramoylpentapeptide beta-N-acetylglucosaminyltransferase [Clostridiales bacterium]|nr:undecaprenyldiphospho-muramoylpentapeptide beta-N-acetylglucosaminyltransferase [Clostridiales bacterium]